ncbi:sugar ABC transporter ATP-binding protein [Thermoanaerobacteraceae bacterium SP2]|jgi:ribose transport system ATP-binding protein|nr:sugar ABC transporter ATP-binding protein [Thermoanaerobacteraceae bacterium SP2]
MSNKDYILEMKGIYKAFPGVQALTDVNLSVERGKVHAICGENGAGKSTLIKILSGAYQKDQGDIYIDGKLVKINEPKDAMDLGIAVIYQEFTLVPHLSVAENIYLGKAPSKIHGIMDWGELKKRAKKLLDSLNVSIPLNCPVKKLSVAQQQIIEITKALASNARILIMDEPSAVLGDKDLEQLFKIIRRLIEQETTIIYISHRLNEVFEISNTITVMKDGKCVGTYPTKSLNAHELVKLMVGRDIGDIYPKRNVKIGEPLLEINNLNQRGRLSNINLNVKRGEIVGLAGLVGAGRTELARAIFGADPIDAGEIKVNGKVIRKEKGISSRINIGVGLLPEDRKAQGLILKMTVRENITISNLKTISKSRKFIDLNREKNLVYNFVNKLRIKTPSIYTKVKSLSGGNQQKVVLAKWLNANSDVLIVDEPTRGVDVGAKREIYELLNEMAASGKAILMISSELPEILGMCDRIYVMHEGKITGEISGKVATEEKIMALATGTDVWSHQNEV